MKTFLLDLWYDLREKRLWPVAVVLALSLVAVPVVLSKPAEEPAPEPPVAAAPAKKPGPLAAVKLAEDAEASGSRLDVFDPEDPFKPPKKVLDEAKAEASGGGSGTQAGPSPSSKGGGTAAGGNSLTGGGDLLLFGGAPGPTGGGDDGGGTTDPSPKTTTTQYAYVIDVTFTAGDRTRRIKGMERLQMLPGQANPLLIFMGVDAKGDNGVFLVDSTLKTAGEGSCRPSASECAFLSLGAGAEQEFSEDDGDGYRLRIDQIRKVKVGPSGASSSRRRGTKASASVGRPRRFVAPLISDLVTVSTSVNRSSNSNGSSR